MRGLTVTSGEVSMRADVRLGRSRLTATIIPKLIVRVRFPSSEEGIASEPPPPEP